MKLVLFSGGQSRSNHLLHQDVVRLAKSSRGKKPLTLTYFPFCSDNASIYFHRLARRYKLHGVEQCFCLPTDIPQSQANIKKAFESDIIYLAGGNTFYFLHHLRKSGMLERLKTFASRGGVLAGLSAGALIMSPTVKLAADKGLGPDENEVKEKNHQGLNLFPFEFSPHFDPTKKQIQAHLNYSRKTENPVVAAEDGSGIVINDHEIMLRGKISLFMKGIHVKAASTFSF